MGSTYLNVGAFNINLKYFKKFTNNNLLVCENDKWNNIPHKNKQYSTK